MPRDGTDRTLRDEQRAPDDLLLDREAWSLADIRGWGWERLTST